MNIEKVNQAEESLREEAYKVQLAADARSDTTMIAVTLPVRSLLRNASQASWDDAVAAIADAMGDESAYVDMLLDAAQHIADAMGLSEPNLTRGATLRNAVEAAITTSIFEDVWPEGANVCYQESIDLWDDAVAALKAPEERLKALKAATSGTRPSVGKLGYTVRMECEHCHKVLTGSSSVGSCQDQMKKHYSECLKVETPYRGSPIHAGFTEALNAVCRTEAPANTAQGGGFILTTDRG